VYGHRCPNPDCPDFRVLNICPGLITENPLDLFYSTQLAPDVKKEYHRVLLISDGKTSITKYMPELNDDFLQTNHFSMMIGTSLAPLTATSNSAVYRKHHCYGSIIGFNAPDVKLVGAENARAVVARFARSSSGISGGTNADDDSTVGTSPNKLTNVFIQRLVVSYTINGRPLGSTEIASLSPVSQKHTAVDIHCFPNGNSIRVQRLNPPKISKRSIWPFTMNGKEGQLDIPEGSMMNGVLMMHCYRA